MPPRPTCSLTMGLRAAWSTKCSVSRAFMKACSRACWSMLGSCRRDACRMVQGVSRRAISLAADDAPRQHAPYRANVVKSQVSELTRSVSSEHQAGDQQARSGSALPGGGGPVLGNDGGDLQVGTRLISTSGCCWN